MFILWGSENTTDLIGEGTFYCPSCQGKSQYEHQWMRAWMTIFFVPVIPVGAGECIVQCRRCQNRFREDVLTMPPARTRAATYCAGDRVLGKRGAYWYCGVALGASEGRVSVLFDDGKRECLFDEEVIPLHPCVGDVLFARTSNDAEYQRGTIIGIEPFRLEVQFEDGSQAWVKFANVRIVCDDK
jgi:hypothetical protein